MILAQENGDASEDQEDTFESDICQTWISPGIVIVPESSSIQISLFSLGWDIPRFETTKKSISWCSKFSGYVFPQMIQGFRIEDI